MSSLTEGRQDVYNGSAENLGIFSECAQGPRKVSTIWFAMFEATVIGLISRGITTATFSFD